MNSSIRSLALTSVAACAVIGVSAVGVATASAANLGTNQANRPAQSTSSPSSNEIERLINANMTDHDLDMTITTGDGTTIHQIVKARSGWYPEAEYGGQDTITVRDHGAVAFVGHFTYVNGDWKAGQMNPTPGLRYTWHTGPFGGFDFR